MGEELILTDKELISSVNENNPLFNGHPEYSRKNSTMTLLNSATFYFVGKKYEDKGLKIVL